jgi:hypothetical protein
MKLAMHMYKIIQNYSILVFPAIAGCSQLIWMFGTDDKMVYPAILGTVMTVAVLAPMLRVSRLSDNKSKRVKFFYGFIALVLFYVSGLILNFILVQDLEIFGKPWYKTDRNNFLRSNFSDFFEHIEYIEVAFKALPMCLIVFLPANIAVILCFLLNDIYSKKIGKIISCFSGDRRI